jgi:hypothetical protein
MEEILSQKYYHNTVHDWLVSLAIITVTILLAKLILLGGGQDCKRLHL